MTPKVEHSAAGMMRIASISRKFESGVGFSSGWAELALKKPPPSPALSCLMATCDATGPTAIAWSRDDWSMEACAEGANVWMTPSDTRASARTSDNGSRM